MSIKIDPQSDKTAKKIPVDTGNGRPRFKGSAPDRTAKTSAFQKVERDRLIEYAEKISDFARKMKDGSDLEILYHGDGDGVATAYIIGELMRKLLEGKGVKISFHELSSAKTGALDGGKETLATLLAAKGKETCIFGCDLFMDALLSGGALLTAMAGAEKFGGALWLDHHEDKKKFSVEELSASLEKQGITLISPALLFSTIEDPAAHNAASLAEVLANQLHVRNEKIAWLADVAREADFAPARKGNFSPSSNLPEGDVAALSYMLNLVPQAGNGGAKIALEAVRGCSSADELSKDPALSERFKLLRGHLASFASAIIAAAEGRKAVVAMLPDEVNRIGGTQYSLASAMANEISKENRELAESLGNRPLILGTQRGGVIRLSIRWNDLPEGASAGKLIESIGKEFGDEAAGGGKGSGARQYRLPALSKRQWLK